MTGNKKTAIRSPYPLPTKFPGAYERACYKIYNYVENRIWPVRPLPFVASCAAVAAANIRSPDNIFISSFPQFENQVFESLKIALISITSVYLPVVVLRQLLKYFYFSYKGFLFENPKKPSIKTRLWGIVRYVLSFSPPILESCDRLLPNLPLPPLKSTVDKYLDSVKCLLSKEEFDLVSEQAESFVNNEGRSLQRYAWVYSMFTDNYVTPFWEKYAYLYSRDPLLINSSVAHCDLIRDKDSTRAHRAARIVWIESRSHLAIDRQQYKALGDGLVCTRHYKKMYCVSREPGLSLDHLVLHGIQKHVVVILRGVFYKVDICDSNNQMFTVNQLTKIFGELIARGESNEDVVSRIASLTHDSRDSWHKNRQRFFLDNEVNRRTLELIESAIFFFSLDEDDNYGYEHGKPEILSNFLRSMLTGNGANRWVDKSLNYICSKNARAGGTTEHSIADGAEFDHIMENFVYIDLNNIGYDAIENQVKMEHISDEEKPKLVLAQKLDFEIVNDEMSTEIERCHSAHQTQKDEIDLFALVFRDFGKGRIKKCGVSPDAFIQMAIQLANYRDQGKFVLTYEPASVRFFANSRTETLRTVNEHSCNFVNSMLDKNETKEKCIELLRKACVTHVDKNKECMVGGGIDRHLFVLFVLSKGTGTSSAFLDHYISQKWLLSTSHVPNVTNQNDEDTNQDNTWLGACFGPVASEGYGVCYRFGGNHSIIANITSKKSSPNTDSTRFAQRLSEAFVEISNLFD